MIVLVDIGNSFTKVATAEGTRLTSTARLTTHPERTPDEIFIELKTLGIRKPKDAVICSVVPALTERFVEMFRSRFNLGNPLVVTPYVNTGITILYRNLSNLGADRIANAVGAYFDYGRDVAVVDFGTATTIDFVTSKGEYLGGIIAPGLEISLNNLISKAPKLFEIKPKKPSRYVGRSTEECLQSGSYLLTVGLIEAVRAAVRRETKTDFTFIATGGLADRFAPFANAIELVDRDITLKGCLHLYRLNKGDADSREGDDRDGV